MSSRQVVIVGAGPAGMAAAVSLCQAGIRPTLIDENHQVGGQIYRAAVDTPPNGSAADSPPNDAVNVSPANAERGRQLRQRFGECENQIELLSDTTVWGVFPQRRLAISRAGGWQMVEAEHLILATGAFEYVSPFPGWTLPGVMTPGGAQLMVKSMGVRPGRRALIAGSGPFLLVVANQLQAAGVEVVGVVEAIRRRETVSHWAALLSNWSQLCEGFSYFHQLRRAGIPIHWGHVVTDATGKEGVRQVTVSPCDPQWRPLRRERFSVDVDTLCVGFGFVPRTELAQMAECRTKYDDLRGGWVPEVDDDFHTSAPNVWVAGDGGGVAGAFVAELEGRLVGLNVAKQLGSTQNPDRETEHVSATVRLAKLQRFRTALDHMYRIRPGLRTLATSETIVCRCEELTRREVEAGIRYGGTNIRTLKVITRLGMGPCQGRMCWPTVSRIVASQSRKSVERCGPLSVRPPASPLCVDDLLNSIELPDGNHSSGIHDHGPGNVTAKSIS